MKPKNFAMIDDRIGGMAIPEKIEEIQYLKKIKIEHIISLTADKPLVAYYTDIIKFHHLPVYATPSENTIQKFLQIITQNSGKIVVHCQYGQERTGIMLAIYLVEIKNYSISQAIKEVRNKRPGSLESYHSIEFLENRYK